MEIFEQERNTEDIVQSECEKREHGAKAVFEFGWSAKCCVQLRRLFIILHIFLLVPLLIRAIILLIFLSLLLPLLLLPRIQIIRDPFPS